ncbi:MAG TPA: LysR family transcriptional regulator [Rhodopila sp.]|nr:LysR family transcriptional regulator [Rhodopila sp.]
MVDLRSLEVFFWVVKLGGFGRAAERLHMTQPAVSARISQIEARFAARLLDRAPNRAAVPTPKGMELYAYAERMLSLQAELEARLSGGASQSGIARIGIAETLVHTMLGNVIRRLHQRHPGITPEITVEISPTLQTMLLAGEIDVAMMLGPVNDPRVRNVLLGDYEMAWVASPALPIGEAMLGAATPGKATLGPAELARWPLLSYSRGTLPHTQLSALFSRPELPAVRIFSSSSLASVISMAVDGIGIGVVPLAVVQTELTAERLRLLNVEHALPPLRFTASSLATAMTGLAATIADVAGQVATAS